MQSSVRMWVASTVVTSLNPHYNNTNPQLTPLPPYTSTVEDKSILKTNNHKNPFLLHSRRIYHGCGYGESREAFTATTRSEKNIDLAAFRRHLPTKTWFNLRRSQQRQLENVRCNLHPTAAGEGAGRFYSCNPFLYNIPSFETRL